MRNEFDRLYELLAARIRRYPSTIKGDAMCGEHGALREIHRMMQIILAERMEQPTQASGRAEHE